MSEQQSTDNKNDKPKSTDADLASLQAEPTLLPASSADIAQAAVVTVLVPQIEGEILISDGAVRRAWQVVSGAVEVAAEDIDLFLRHVTGAQPKGPGAGS